MSRAKRAERTRTRNLDVSREAKRRGSAILEVLSGLRSPTEASELLGITCQRYYKLETRAVQGLLQSLESMEDRRRRKSPGKELAQLAAERDRLKRELLRAQALVRVARRTVGLPTSTRSPKAEKGKQGSRRRRKPVVRARRLAEQLRRESGEPAAPSPATAPSPAAPSPATAPVQRSAS